MREQGYSVLMVLESTFPSPGGGGAESQVRTLGLEFLRRGQALEVIVPMVAGGPQQPREQIEGIPVTRIAYPKVPWLGAGWMLLSLAWLLFARRHAYAVIHAHIAGNMAAVCSLMGRWLDKPVLVKLTGMTEMRGGILDKEPRLGGRLRKSALLGSSAYQATSRRIGALLAERGFDARKVLHLPNAVDTRRFARVVRDQDLRRQLCGLRERVGIFVGRLEPEKGIELMVKGWAQAFAGRGDAALLLVGDGSLRTVLAEMGRELGIEQQIVFTGATNEVERYLALADFGLLTSQYEGLSNSLLEYMASGLPVVGSQVSGTEDWVIDGRTGWLFPAGDLAALERALCAVRETPMPRLRQLGQQARQLVEEQASIGAVVDTLQKTYRDLSPLEAGLRTVGRP
ncbi:MAG: glycosyltransferase [Rubrivivax sp.]|nr:glycosyltransferase [Rubrivivax sp.]